VTKSSGSFFRFLYMLAVEIKVQSAWKKHRAERIVIWEQHKEAAEHVLRIETIKGGEMDDSKAELR
jgi:hypothetical protein